MGIGGLVYSAAASFIVPAIFLVSLVSFIWASAKYRVDGSYNEEEKEKAKMLMAYSILVFWIMMLAWFGLQYFAQTLGAAGI
jgi:hypothetical protein